MLPTVDHKDARIKYDHLKKDLQTIEKEYLGLLPKNLKEEYDELLERQEVLKNNEAFLAAARMIRLFTPAYLKLLKKFRDAISEGYRQARKSGSSRNTWFEGAPLMVPSKEPGMIIVFPYLILNRTSRQDLENLCYLLCFDTLGTFLDVMKSKPRNWAPFNRAWTKIKKQEVMTVEKAFNRYTNMAKDVPPSMINRFAQAYLEMDKPLELQYTEKREDWQEMFGTGTQSCMTLTPEKTEHWQDLVDAGSCPPAMLHEHPYIKGVYAVARGGVIGRTYLYQQEKGNEKKDNWFYGRVYAPNGRARDAFINALNEQGYKQIASQFTRQVTYQIDAIMHKRHGDWMLPVPYTDNIDQNIRATFNPKDEKWTLEFNCKNGAANLQLSSTQGYVLAKHYQSIPCTQCGKGITGGRYLQPSGNRELFYCSERCIKADDWVQARQKDGQSRWIHIDNCYQDYFTRPGIIKGRKSSWNAPYYSTRAAIRAYGASRVMHRVDIKNGNVVNIELSPEEYTRVESPYAKYVTWRGNTYVMEKSKHDELVKSGHIGTDGEVKRSA